MAKTALFIKDQFNGQLEPGGHSQMVIPSSSHVGNLPENIHDPRPGVGLTLGDGMHRCLVDRTCRYIQASTTPTGSVTTIDLDALGHSGFHTASTLATAITSAFATTGGIFANWGCGWDPATRKFRLGHGGTGTDLVFRWKTGSHGSGGTNTSMARELGFYNDSDSAWTFNHVGSYEVGMTYSYLRFTLEEAHQISLWACQVGIDNSWQESQSDISIFSSNTNWGNNIMGWQDSATWLRYSGQAEHEANHNPLRLAVKQNTRSNNPYHLFLWRHWDGELYHTVNFCKAYTDTTSGSGRTISALDGHTLVDPSPPMNSTNYWPTKSLLRWEVPLAFNSWPVADYRAMVQLLVKAQREAGVVWILDWDTVHALPQASMNKGLSDRANEGMAVYGSLQRYSGDSYQGGRSAFMSGEVLLEQLR